MSPATPVLEPTPGVSAQLAVLKLSNNNIDAVHGLEGLEELRELDLANNVIESTADVRALGLSSALMSLNLAGNPCVDSEPLYRQALSHMVPQLLLVDGVKQVRRCSSLLFLILCLGRVVQVSAAAHTALISNEILCGHGPCHDTRNTRLAALSWIQTTCRHTVTLKSH